MIAGGPLQTQNVGWCEGFGCRLRLPQQPAERSGASRCGRGRRARPAALAREPGVFQRRASIQAWTSSLRLSCQRAIATPRHHRPAKDRAAARRPQREHGKSYQAAPTAQGRQPSTTILAQPAGSRQSGRETRHRAKSCCGATPGRHAQLRPPGSLATPRRADSHRMDRIGRIARMCFGPDPVYPVESIPVRGPACASCDGGWSRHARGPCCGCQAGGRLQHGMALSWGPGRPQERPARGTG